MVPGTTTPAAQESLELRAQRLAAARRWASALLAAVTAVFVAVTVTGAHGTLLGYVQAGAEAAMVGGVADWFAVTALFRRPLGLPIPHTALIVERKDQFAATLGQFVQENFLNGDVLAERISAARPVPRLAAWLADTVNAGRLAGHAADLVVNLAQSVRDEDVERMLTAELMHALEGIDAAPLAGRALRLVLSSTRRAELTSAAVGAAGRYVGDHRDELRDRFAGESPRWVPDAVYRIAFDRLYGRLQQRLAAMASDPDDPTRRQLDDWLTGLPDRLETSPELRAQADRIKHDILGSDELRDWSGTLWQHAKEGLRGQAADPDSRLRRRLAEIVATTGERVGSDQRLQDGIERMLESGAQTLAGRYRDELAGLVTGTIQRWDAAQTSTQLELLFGRDLQYIRVNGTVVGAGVGLALHAIAAAIG
jgi:uncharacterized membrane-anchored protein YjiN (DUF445 family)